MALAKLRRGALLDHAHTAAAGLKSAWPQRAQCALGEFLSFADVCNNIWWHFSWEDPWNIYGIMGYIYIIIMKTYIYIYLYLYNDTHTHIYIHIIYYAFQWDILWELYGIWDVHGIRIEWDIFIWLIKDGRPLDSCGRLMHGINRDDFHWPPPFWIPSEHSHGKWPIYRWFTYGLPIKNGDFPWLC